MLLYIHIPFCASKCGYCAFHSLSNQQDLYAPYVQALCKDIQWSLQTYRSAPHTPLVIDSVFIGGGTPNILPSHFYEKIFATIHKYAQLSETCEITLEANVNLIESQWCRNLIALGANRLSIGVQSFIQEKLNLLERDHQVNDIECCFSIAYHAGFKNISCDLIYGTSIDNPSLLANEIKYASNLPINHLSAYTLSIDEGSRFARYTKKTTSADDWEEWVRENLHKQGFLQYEVSNYSRGYECQHNLGYWLGLPYIGCGSGAVGRVKNTRTQGLLKLDSYIKHPTRKNIETLSESDLKLEEIMLGLRCKIGVNCKRINLSSKRTKILLKSQKCHIESRQNGDYLVANELFLADEIALWLTRED